MKQVATPTGITVTPATDGGLNFFIFDGPCNQTLHMKFDVSDALTLCAAIVRMSSKSTKLSIASLVEGIVEEARVEPEDDSRCEHCGGIC